MNRSLLPALAPYLWFLQSCTAPSPEEDTGLQSERLCSTTFSHRSDIELDGVSLIGDFNAWDDTQVPMEQVQPGLWSTTLQLAPGSYAYRFSERIDWTVKGFDNSVCDPAASLLLCEEGTQDWPEGEAICVSGEESLCSSLLQVHDCRLPELEFLQIGSEPDGLVAEIGWIPGLEESPLETLQIQLDGRELTSEALETGSAEIIFDDPQFRLELSGLNAGHHELQVTASDSSGTEALPITHRFWTDEREDWRHGTIYFAFVDRFANGDPSRDTVEGASADAGEYLGGDWAGVEAALPYLEELGIQTLWLSNPQSNANGAWAGDCGETYTGYHAYWPDAQGELESHFGDEAALQSLIEAAHDRGLRVIMDWVGNHVHSDHPWAQSGNPEWFHAQEICEDSVSGESNWNRIPETCWFAPYLPDLDYSQPEVMTGMLTDALAWVDQYGFDGLRVDAVKHMPHSLSWNLENRIQEELEHRNSGGSDTFWTLGETFDSREQIASYLSSEVQPQLDGQFDFPLYYALLDSVAWSQSSLAELETAVSESQALYGDGVMANFLGNHDTGRFSTLAAGEGDLSCLDDAQLVEAQPTENPEAYARMRIAWTFLFTQRPAPLIYYGDEIAVPGFGDPDNRQSLWSHGLNLSTSPSLDEALAQLDEEPRAMLSHVSHLSKARQSHPEIWNGESHQWWLGPEEWPTVWAWTRVDPESGFGSLVILNLSDEEVTLANHLGFAGLAPEGTYIDLLDESTVDAADDWLEVSVPAMSSRVLVNR